MSGVETGLKLEFLRFLEETGGLLVVRTALGKSFTRSFNNLSNAELLGLIEKLHQEKLITSVGQISGRGARTFIVYKLSPKGERLLKPDTAKAY